MSPQPPNTQNDAELPQELFTELYDMCEALGDTRKDSTKQFAHLKGLIEAHLQAAVRAAENKAKADAYDDARYWLEDRLTSKKDVASICATRSAVLRGEIEAPKSRFDHLKQEGKTNG